MAVEQHAPVEERHRTVAEDAVARRLGETWEDLIKRVARALADEGAHQFEAGRKDALNMVENALTVLESCMPRRANP